MNFPRMEDDLLIIRRRTLYPGEVRGHEPKYFTPFVRACQLRKTAHASCAEASHQKPPPSWTPGGGAEHRRRAAYPFRRLCYTISWDNWEEGFVKKHNFRQSHQIYYLYLQHKSSKIFRINAYHNALCILFFLPKSSSKISSVPAAQTGKQKARLLKQTGFGGGGWIRTTVGIASRFTVCPLWPLGNTPVFASLSVELVDGLEPPTC